jgi:4-carboxymuconolactone decarboxylase
VPDEKYKKGMQVRKSVLGEDHVNLAETNKSDFDADFQHLMTEVAWGSVWARPGLNRKTRHLLTMAMLETLGNHEELAMHIRATPNTGVTREDVKEVLLQVAVYAGIPAANAAIAIAKRVFAEMDGKG